jgi:cation:H+ antiporter
MVLAGFWILIKGADLMVNGAVVVAQRFRLTPAVIGATVVAFGTSLPELMVSLFSALAAAREGSLTNAEGPAAIAIANVVGSNIFNLGAVLGISALIRVLPAPDSSRRLDFPLMLLSGLLLIGLSWPFGGNPAHISRWEGLLLVSGLIGFVVLSIRGARRSLEEIPPAGDLGPGTAALLILGGILMLVVGGDITLTGGLRLARAIGMSERVIGLTVMAIGTSLPELVTSIQAARRGHTAIAVGNVLGSNCFNVLCIIGISSLVVDLPVNATCLSWDYWWMLGFGLLLIPAIYGRGGIGRPTGVVLILALISYIWLILASDLAPKAAVDSGAVEQQRSEVGATGDDVIRP